ncbi:MAG: hypothetical protein JNL93_26870 [Pelomonas sp.]|nr:hypothetical protein [Roseateles sp.]
MKLPIPSSLTIVRLTALVVFIVSAFFLDGRFSILTFLAFVVLLGCTVVATRKASKQFDIRGLKRLRDIFPKSGDR